MFGYAKRRDQEYVGIETLEMLPPGMGRRRREGRQKQRLMDCVNRDMRAIGTTKVHDRTGWIRIVFAAATPQLVGSARRKNGKMKIGGSIS